MFQIYAPVCIPPVIHMVMSCPFLSGPSTAEACRRIAVSEQTQYRWRKESGGLKTDQARRMKDLEENLRLRRATSDLTLDKLLLQEAARGNF